MGIFEDRPDEKIAQTGARIEVGELSFRPSIHAAAFGADPEGIVRADADGEECSFLPVVRRVDHGDASFTRRAESATAGPGPDGAFAIFIEAADPGVRKAVGVGEVRKGAVRREDEQSLIQCACPEMAAPAFKHGGDGASSPRRAAPDLVWLAGRPAADAFVVREPKAAVATATGGLDESVAGWLV